MGSVWRAQHLALEAPVAIKFVHVQGGDQARFLARFEREAKLAASVRHRNVVSITDYGHMPDGTAFMVMDCLDGEPFADYLETQPSPAEVLYIAELTTRGLVAVHEAGIVHRDLKPENIFICRDATGVYPKLIDFGISKHLRPEGERRSAVTTQEGAIFGTPAYMSPEQARGLTDIDERTDIYSMGVILYEALAGKLPYESQYVGDLMLAIVVGGAQPLHEVRPDLDPRLGDVVMKAMAHDARARYQTARELLAALGTLAPGRGALVRSDRPPLSRSGSSGRDSYASLAFEHSDRFGRELSIAHSAVPNQVLATMQERATQRRRARVKWSLIGLAGAIITGGALAWPDPRGTPLAGSAGTEQGAPATHVPPSAVNPTADATPKVAAATSIIELSGLPPGALVQLDGKPATARIELPRDPAVHTIAVTAVGHQPWSREVRADADARISVTLVPEPAPTAAKPQHKATPKPATQAQRPARPKSGVITELDY